MIRSESEYQEAVRREEQGREVTEQMRVALDAQGLTPEEIETATEPVLSFQAQLTEEINQYGSTRRRDLSPAPRLTI